MGEKPFDIKERTFEFGTDIIKLSFSLEQKYGTVRILANQLVRAATSIGANVEEAYGAHTDPDFINKFSIALKEAREASYWIRQFIASQIIPNTELDPLLDECEELKKIIATIVANKRRSQ